jgi:hypothetical protein
VIFLVLILERLAIPILVAGMTVATSLLLVLALLPLLGLLAALLLGPLVQCGGEVLEGTHEMDTKVAFRFVSLLDRLGDSLHGSGELF